MNRLIDVAEAAFEVLAQPQAAEGTPDPLADTEFVMPFDEYRSVAVFRNNLSRVAVLSVRTVPIAADDGAAAERREQLLRSTCDARLTTGLVGSLGPDGTESVSIVLAGPPRDVQHLEGLIKNLLQTIDSAASTGDSSTSTRGAPDTWLKV